MPKHICEIGGIIQHRMNHNRTCGYGFKITFKTSTEAQKYKEMITWIIESDNYKINNKKGYYDGNML